MLLTEMIRLKIFHEAFRKEVAVSYESTIKGFKISLNTLQKNNGVFLIIFSLGLQLNLVSFALKLAES